MSENITETTEKTSGGVEENPSVNTKSGGVCAIKPEFILNETSDETQQQQEEKATDSETDEPQAKKQRVVKKKHKLQNTFTRDVTKELCMKLVNIHENQPFPDCPNPRCPYLHDVQKYLKSKPEDIGETCYTYELRGECPRGIACLFGKSHITPEGKNKVNKEVADKYQPETWNLLSSPLQWSLRKRNYDLAGAEIMIKRYERGIRQHASDETLVRLRKVEKKPIDWKDKLILAPLTTVGNLPFRRICKELGADVTCGEMAMAMDLLQGQLQEWALIKKHTSEDIFGVQLCSNNAFEIIKVAHVLQETMEVDFIDINLGCPVDAISAQGGGCGMLRREHILKTMIICTSQLLQCPLTLSTRTGYFENTKLIHTLIPKFRDWGASMVSLHGRSRDEKYTTVANWDYINECAGLAQPMPVFGAGDILSYEDYKNAREKYPNVSGVTIGRGALIKPWIFTEIKEQKLWDIRSNERFDILKKYTNYGLDHWGSDMRGVEKTRTFMLEWLAFLHRYVPVGILEKPPQKMNERPSRFQGRDDLETLMGSPKIADWVKISEMLLGPVPDSFTFRPTYKANAY